MARWTAFPHDADAYTYDVAALKKKWARLHAGDAEPLPKDDKVLAAWALFHAGQFQKRKRAQGARRRRRRRHDRRQQGPGDLRDLSGGERKDTPRVAARGGRAPRRARASAPDEANAWYCMAYALGRYSQGISIGRALAQGLGTQVKNALETTIRLAPKHADAHIALGAFHAEVIDKVGSLLGRTQGASKEAGLASYRTALKLNPGSAIARIEYANGLVMLEGEKRMKEATTLYEEAAACEPLDATERLDVEMAKAELED